MAKTWAVLVGVLLASCASDAGETPTLAYGASPCESLVGWRLHVSQDAAAPGGDGGCFFGYAAETWSTESDMNVMCSLAGESSALDGGYCHYVGTLECKYPPHNFTWQLDVRKQPGTHEEYDGTLSRSTVPTLGCSMLTYHVSVTKPSLRATSH